MPVPRRKVRVSCGRRDADGGGVMDRRRLGLRIRQTMGESIAAEADVALLADAVVGHRGMAGGGKLPAQDRDQRNRRAAGQESWAEAKHPVSLTEFRDGGRGRRSVTAASNGVCGRRNAAGLPTRRPGAPRAEDQFRKLSSCSSEVLMTSRYSARLPLSPCICSMLFLRQAMYSSARFSPSAPVGTSSMIRMR